MEVPSTLEDDGLWSMAAREDVRIDFFACLPPELVLQIILCLDLKDLLPCLAVCRTWWDILKLSVMEPYWRRACQELGLPGGMVESLLLVTHQSARLLLFASLKHRSSICKSAPRYKQLTSGYPYNVHYVCQYAKGCQLVGTVYRDFQPCHLLVQRVDGESVASVLKLELTYPHIAENRVVWAHIHDCFLFCAAASGIWSAFGLQPASSNGGGSDLLVQWRAEPMYDSDIRIACCNECGMICTAKLVTSHMECSFWEFRAIEISKQPVSSKTKKLPMPKVTRFKLETDNSQITSRRAPFGKKRVSLMSQTAEAGAAGEFCTSHLLLAQWANEVSGLVFNYKIQEDETALCLSPTAVRRFAVECEDYDIMVMRNHGLNTEFVLSEDHSLIGFVFQSFLHTWEVESGNRTSVAKIVLDNYHYEEMKLISLGHIYSIVGLEFDSSVIVLSTMNGQRLLKCADFAKNHCRMVPPFIVFYLSVEDEWLSDITQSCSTRILYWNKTNRSIEGIGLGEPVSHSKTSQPAVSRKQKRWPWPWQHRE